MHRTAGAAGGQDRDEDDPTSCSTCCQRYPVNFGCAFVGVAAGAVPPPPPLSVVVVVSVAVVSVDVEPDEASGVVVVIVVTTVVLPVVIVVTIVVVAAAPNGAAPAVNAAVAAPSVISVANAAPQIAYFLYRLFIPTSLSFLGLRRRFTHPPNSYSPGVSTRILGRDERLD
jgi:hypothetical protein